MNTLNDAQLLVSPEVTELLDRFATAAARMRPSATTSARRLTLLSENGFLVPDREVDRRALDKYFSSVKNDTAELSVTLLTTLQCNFACDYCFQGDHGDYNKFADKMTLETAAQVARLDRARARSRASRNLPADVLRRRAAAQSAGDVLPGRGALGTHAAARRADVDQHHHQRPAADARGGRSAAAVRTAGRQDHARRRPRHAQPDASASRRPGDVRSADREHPQRRRA